jgi:hypothetical protein
MDQAGLLQTAEIFQMAEILNDEDAMICTELVGLCMLGASAHTGKVNTNDRDLLFNKHVDEIHGKLRMFREVYVCSISFLLDEACVECHKHTSFDFVHVNIILCDFSVFDITDIKDDAILLTGFSQGLCQQLLCDLTDSTSGNIHRSNQRCHIRIFVLFDCCNRMYL